MQGAASPYDLVAIGASAGGIAAVEAILERLPADFPLPIALVQHRTTHKPYLLARVLARHTRLKVKQAQEGETLQPGTVYLAPPDRHLVIDERRRLALVDGHRIRHVLSSVNPLFESAAAVLGPRMIGVVLSGYDGDGTDGVQAIDAAGGVVIAQDQASSRAFAMPASAIATGCVDAVLPVERIAAVLVQLAAGALAALAVDPARRVGR